VPLKEDGQGKWPLGIKVDMEKGRPNAVLERPYAGRLK
jgi:hypothetical protein